VAARTRECSCEGCACLPTDARGWEGGARVLACAAACAGVLCVSETQGAGMCVVTRAPGTRALCFSADSQLSTQQDNNSLPPLPELVSAAARLACWPAGRGVRRAAAAGASATLTARCCGRCGRSAHSHRLRRGLAAAPRCCAAALHAAACRRGRQAAAPLASSAELCEGAALTSACRAARCASAVRSHGVRRRCGGSSCARD
jgi:hypothetical protein